MRTSGRRTESGVLLEAFKWTVSAGTRVLPAERGDPIQIGAQWRSESTDPRAAAQRLDLNEALWNRASSRNVGGHWPTNVLQSRLPASHRVAEAAMDAIAAQYQLDWGMLSVSVK